MAAFAKKLGLPTRMLKTFKFVKKSLKDKEYEKGLTAASTILLNHPKHGETLLMKALLLHGLHRKDEAFEIVLDSLQDEPTSFHLWHGYGLLFEADRNYGEAIKGYTNASNIDAGHIEVLQKISILKVLTRDWAGFVDARKKLLDLDPNKKINWICFAISLHLNSNLQEAVDILEKFEQKFKDEGCMRGEMFLYKISLLEECKFFERALTELFEKEAVIVDKVAFKEQKASILTKLGRSKEATKVYISLLLSNPNNYRYYEDLQKCVGLGGQCTPEEVDKLGGGLCEYLKTELNWSSVVERILLYFLHGDNFKAAADSYIRSSLTKGDLSLFDDLSPLYDHAEKADMVEKLILKFEDSLKKNRSFLGSSSEEQSSTYVRTLLFIAQHYDRRGQYDLALANIDKAIEQTPTLSSSYYVKARILKHVGDLAAAASTADVARCMALDDPNINRKCVKRMFQADQVPLAEKTATLFTNDEDEQDYLHEMQQRMWYELAYGESYFRQVELGRALTKFLAVEEYYANIMYHLADSESCLRETSVRKYIDMIKFPDQMLAHSYFQKATAGATRCYMQLFDSSAIKMSNLTKGQKKKLKKKQPKTRAMETGDMDKFSASTSTEKPIIEPKEPDPDGKNLLQVEDPLAEATKHLKLLEKCTSKSLETNILSFELYMRKNNILLALKALKQMQELDADDPNSHRCLIRFFHKVRDYAVEDSYSEEVRSAITDERAKMRFTETSLIKVNESFLMRHKDSLMHRAAASEMMYLLKPESKAVSIMLIEDSANNFVSSGRALGPVREWKLNDCISIHKILESVFIDLNAARNWKVKCSEYFPFSSYFGSREQRQAVKQQLQLRKVVEQQQLEVIQQLQQVAEQASQQVVQQQLVLDKLGQQRQQFEDQLRQQRQQFDDQLRQQRQQFGDQLRQQQQQFEEQQPDPVEEEQMPNLEEDEDLVALQVEDMDIRDDDDDRGNANTNFKKKIEIELFACFVFYGISLWAASFAQKPNISDLSRKLIVSLGVALATLICSWSVGLAGEAHINPNASIAAGIWFKVPQREVIVRWLVQLMWIISYNFFYNGMLYEIPVPKPIVPSGWATISETMLISIMILLRSFLFYKPTPVQRFAPIIMAVYMGFMIFAQSYVSGGGLNLFTALGSSIARRDFADLWVYLIASVGAIVGGGIYVLLGQPLPGNAGQATDGQRLPGPRR